MIALSDMSVLGFKANSPAGNDDVQMKSENQLQYSNAVIHLDSSGLLVSCTQSVVANESDSNHKISRNYVSAIIPDSSPFGYGTATPASIVAGNGCILISHPNEYWSQHKDFSWLFENNLGSHAPVMPDERPTRRLSYGTATHQLIMRTAEAT